VLTQHALADCEVGHLPRHSFYDRAAEAFAIVRTGELRAYGNILLVKGVVARPTDEASGLLVVFGSINLDLVARVPRLPRPGETLAGTGFVTSPGGKGANQALAARRSGAEVALFGAVGGDAFAAPALALLQAAGIDLSGVRQADAPTGVALIHVDDAGQNAITVIPGANALARAADVPTACSAPARR